MGPQKFTTSSAIAKGLCDALVSRNLALQNILFEKNCNR